MKKTIIALSLVLSNVVYGQVEKREKIAIGKTQNWQITNLIEDRDTSTYFYWGFQNKKYETIVDIGSVIESSKSELKKFAEKLIEYGNIKEKINQSELVCNIRIELYDFSHNLYITEDRGKYTYISKKEAIKFGEEILNYYELLKSE
jgi:hypothetical protein